MTEWTNIVVVLCLILLLLLLWLALRRIQKSRLVWRCLASGVAVFSLALLTLPLYVKKQQPGETSALAVLLTEGFNPDSVRQFLSEHPGSPVFFMNKNLKAQPFGAVYVPNPVFVPPAYTSLMHWHLFGYGLRAAELGDFKGKYISFHPSPLPSGITAIHWQPQLPTGERLLVQGVCYNTTQSPLLLKLTSFGTTLDSVAIPTARQTSFSLSTVPKVLGKSVYSISVMSGSDTLEKESIPVVVTAAVKINVLMLASAPDFEQKFLQNYLTAEGYGVAGRTQISQNKYAYSYRNVEGINLTQINAATLQSFDVVVADANALSSLEKGALAGLQTQLTQGRAGLIVTGDSLPAAAFYSRNFRLLHAGVDSGAMLQPLLADSTYSLPSLPLYHTAYLSANTSLQPLLSDKREKLYAATALYGAGKILFSTLPNTYAWVLSGHEGAYQHLWATYLNKVIPPKPATEAWHVAPLLPSINEEVAVILEKESEPNVPSAIVNGASVYLSSDVRLPYVWTGTYYPVLPGWQTIVGESGDLNFWYAFGKTDWQNVWRSQKILATEQYISDNLYNQENTITSQLIKQSQVSKLYPLLLFLFCCAFLWLEEKYILSANS